MRSLLIIAVILLPIILAPLTGGEIIPDSEDKVIHSGEAITFHFTIINRANETVFFVIHSPEEKGWIFNVTPTTGLIEPESTKDVKVRLISPEVYVEIEKDFSVEVFIYNSTGMVSKYIYHLHISLIPPSTFFFFFNLPFPKSWGYWGPFISVVLTWLIISLLLYFIFPFIKRFTKWTKTKVDDILVEILKKPVAIWIIIYGLLNASLTLPITTQVSFLLVKIYDIIVIVIVTWIIYRVFRDLIISYAFHISRRRGRRDLEKVLLPVIEKIGIVTIVVIGGIMLLQEAGVNIAVLVASLGVAGIIIGLAAQDTLGNFFAGLHILLDKAFEIGDLILLEGEESVYEVKHVGLRSTKLYDIFSHTMIYIPNSMLANHKIVNLDRPDTQIKIKIDISVSYDSDIEKVKRVLMEIAESSEDVLKDESHKPVVVFREFGDSSLNFTLYLWVKDVKKQWKVASRIREEIMRRFREEGIEIPYPQLDVHMK
ncbi:MAG: mechanosensitive ion channel family protein [Thermoplasmata archaeon]|nr:mechanosensitive ion channel family protein [Thermoplasmata archaeon]